MHGSGTCNPALHTLQRGSAAGGQQGPPQQRAGGEQRSAACGSVVCHAICRGSAPFSSATSGRTSASSNQPGHHRANPAWYLTMVHIAPARVGLEHHPPCASSTSYVKVVSKRREQAIPLVCTVTLQLCMLRPLVPCHCLQRSSDDGLGCILRALPHQRPTFGRPLSTQGLTSEAFVEADMLGFVSCAYGLQPCAGRVFRMHVAASKTETHLHVSVVAGVCSSKKSRGS